LDLGTFRYSGNLYECMQKIHDIRLFNCIVLNAEAMNKDGTMNGMMSNQ
jgi:hypothetical protein